MTDLQAAWIPSQASIEKTHLYQLMREKDIPDFKAFHRWSVEQPDDFLQTLLSRFPIVFKQHFTSIMDTQNGVENIEWFKNASMNIVDSCFQAYPNKTAIVYQQENQSIQSLSYAQLKTEVDNVSRALLASSFKKGDAIAICMPMTPLSVAIFLGIIQAGCSVVGIAESFSPAEIQSRLEISHAKAIFVQDGFVRNQKYLPLYEKIKSANAPLAVVYFSQSNHEALRDQDISFEHFLKSSNHTAIMTSIACDPDDTTVILFSSGTTGTPKAIPWSHSTPIKSAIDAYLHHDLHPEDIITWPSSLGWMMGAWLIFASLINRSTMALFEGAPTSRAFGEFIERAKITVVGVVPSIVKAWRAENTMKDLDWSHIKCFTSTGEASNPDDYLFLMSLAQNKPIIEYCGGTEIGGAYITSTLIEPNIPSCFSTPACGMDFLLLDEKGNPCDHGEVALIAPALGLSTQLLNKDHYAIYYADMPVVDHHILRRHGDEIIRLPNGYYRALGRTDDTMNLGGIKVSSIEIERCFDNIPEILETAAVAVSPENGGPSELVIYVVLNPHSSITLERLKEIMQQALRTQLNPLFKISELKIKESLPRTASNKIMRRLLRDL